METLIFDWTKKINENELNKVVEIINNDGVIIFPTDTVYGIGCNCYNEKAIKKIFDLKGRDYSKPINVLIGSVKKIDELASSINEKERKLINKYMPGDMTIILKKNDNVPDLLTANLDSVGVRIPNNKIALEILNRVDFPLGTTSANISGEVAMCDFNDVVSEFNGKVDVIINGGESEIGVASTIVRVDDGEIKILRQGNLKIDL